MILSRDRFELPGVQSWVAGIADDLDKGQTVCLLLPQPVEAGLFWPPIRERLGKLGNSIAEVHTPGIPTGARMPSELAKALGVKWPASTTPRTLPELVRNPELPGIIHLEDWAELAPAAQHEWLTIARRWADYSRSASCEGEGSTALLIIANATDNLQPTLDSDVAFRIRLWWQVPSVLETMQLCRITAEGSWRTPLHEWREHILPSLVAGDLEAATEIWDDSLWDVDSLLPRLDSLAEKRGWTRGTIEPLTNGWFTDQSPVVGAESGLEPPRRLLSLWARGLVCSTLEYGPTLSPVALAVLGNRREIERRLWRGQVGLLMPIIDELRLDICGRWARRFGADWPTRWTLPDSEEEARAIYASPLNCGWGHMETLLRGRAELIRERPLLPMIAHSRYVRNELAHSRPVRYYDFKELLDARGLLPRL
ncbi:MAG: hypothetical protein BWY10_00846 [Chloroflexi bacterium ADurb.Bin180]|nr:MAG: hypothetical protein BWY10_00846 [Chloroflexi bacterium ADurb.Bin180]